MIMAAKNKDIFVHPIRKYQTLLTKAETFFKAEKETEYQPIIIFVFLYVLVGQILEFVAWVPSLGSLGGAERLPLPDLILSNIFLGVIGILLSPVLIIIGTFIIAGAVHLGVSCYKKGQPFFQTWKVIAYAALIPIIYNVFSTLLTTITESFNPWPDQSIYSQMPVFGPYYVAMTGLLVIIGLIVLVHAIYTEIVGIKLYHKLSAQQAAVAVIVPTLMLFFLLVAVVMGIMMVVRFAGLVV